MITLRRAKIDELAHFSAMEQQDHIFDFIIPTTLQHHQSEFAKAEIIYLSMLEEDGSIPGYFILAMEVGTTSVEFRRIVVDQDARGIGQIAIGLMEKFCRQQLGATRIWLDVFDNNDRGKHIYEKLGYRRFREEVTEGRKLLFYEKQLDPEKLQ